MKLRAHNLNGPIGPVCACGRPSATERGWCGVQPEELCAFAGQCGPLKLEAWIDDPPRLVLRPAYIDAIKALPLYGVRVMVDGPAPGLDDRRWSVSQLRELAAALPRHRRILTCWVPAQKGPLDQLDRMLDQYFEALDTDTLEGDAEPVGKWNPKSVKGFPSLDAAADYTVDLAHKRNKRFEVTVFPGAIAHAAPLIKRADGYAQQNYPVAERDGKAMAYDGKLGPLRMPYETLLAARKRFPHVHLISGLPAYKQAWRGAVGTAAATPKGAMNLAIASSVAAGVDHLCYWSIKHIVRFAEFKQSPWAREVLEALTPIAVLPG